MALGTTYGYYIDASGVAHGFLRAFYGGFITFSAPGAGTASGQGTFAFSLNPEGTLVGYSIDSNGAYTDTRAPSGARSRPSTLPERAPAPIRVRMAITSTRTAYSQATSGTRTTWHTPTLRTRNGNFTIINVPGAGTGAGQGTGTAEDIALNAEGVLTGAYIDSNNTLHGYVRATDGTITSINAPGAGTGAGQGTDVDGINLGGSRFQGIYIDSSGVDHGFVRAPDGTITEFDVPGAGMGSGQGTVPEGLNVEGAITGSYIDTSSVDHGFLRNPHGAITTFDVPGAGTGAGQGTFPLLNNVEGTITGYDIDDNGVAHGIHTYAVARTRGGWREASLRGASNFPAFNRQGRFRFQPKSQPVNADFSCRCASRYIPCRTLIAECAPRSCTGGFPEPRQHSPAPSGEYAQIRRA